MSLFDYEHLKEYQCNYKQIIQEVKSIVELTNIAGDSLEITLNKEKLEKFLLNYAIDNIESKNLEYARAIFISR